MSTIETTTGPPSVETIVIPFDEEVIQNALEESCSDWAGLFPAQSGQHHRSGCLTHPGPRAEARIVIGHGQMEAKILGGVVKAIHQRRG